MRANRVRTFAGDEREESGIVIHVAEDITHLYVIQSVKKVFQKTIQLCLEIMDNINYEYTIQLCLEIMDNINYEYQYQGLNFEDLATLPSVEQSHLVDCSSIRIQDLEFSGTHQESITVCLRRR